MEPIPPTVEGCCNLLSRSKLLPPDEIKTMYQKWRGKAGAAFDNLNRFIAWLIAEQYVSLFQANVLRKGRADRLILGEYRVVDRIGQGRMAGVYKAAHRL